MDGWLLISVLVILYLLPAIVAAYFHHRNGAAILALNILFGWTLIGWVLALVWSLTDNRAKR